MCRFSCERVRSPAQTRACRDTSSLQSPGCPSLLVWHPLVSELSAPPAPRHACSPPHLATARWLQPQRPCPAAERPRAWPPLPDRCSLPARSGPAVLGGSGRRPGRVSCTAPASTPCPLQPFPAAALVPRLCRQLPAARRLSRLVSRAPGRQCSRLRTRHATVAGRPLSPGPTKLRLYCHFLVFGKR